MSENKNEAAFPVHADTISRCGLTKREYFAGLALQGLLSSPSTDIDQIITAVPYDAVRLADALLAELSKS